MISSTLQELLRSTPFTPFTVHLSGGQSYFVDHPDFATVTRGGGVLLVNLPGGDGDRVAHVATAMIERLETAEAPQKA